MVTLDFISRIGEKSPRLNGTSMFQEEAKGCGKISGLLGLSFARKREFFRGCTSTSGVGRRRSCRVPSQSLLQLLYLPQHRRPEQLRPQRPCYALHLSGGFKRVERSAQASAAHNA